MAELKLLTDEGLRRLVQLINAKFADKLNKSDIVNDLTTGGTNKALSAEQGKVLFQNVDDGKQRIANAIIDKGQTGVSKDSSFQELATAISEIESGGVGAEYIPQTTDDKVFLSYNSRNVASFLNANRLKIVVFPNMFQMPASCFGTFSSLSKLRVVPGLDMTRTEDATEMFRWCSKLEFVGSFQTTPKLKNTTGMFKGCTSLKELPKFDTSGVKHFDDMFIGCTSLNIPKMRQLGWDEKFLATAPNYRAP